MPRTFRTLHALGYLTCEPRAEKDSSLETQILVASILRQSTKKADVAEHPKVFHHVGLLVIEPPGRAGLLLI
jgi:hypothetical protein